MPVPPGATTPFMTPFQAPFGTPVSGNNAVMTTPAKGPVMTGRRSVMPRMSTMPSAPNKMLIGGGAAPQGTISVSEYQAVKAEVNRLRMQLDQSNEKLEEERVLRQRKEDEALTSFKRLQEQESKLARFQREHDRHDRRHRRDEDAKAQSENKLKNAINSLQSSLDDVKDDKEALAGKLSELSATFAQKEKELLEEQAHKKSLEHDNQELLSANDALESRLHALKTDYTDCKKRLDQAEGHANGLRDTMRDMREEHEAHARALAQEKQNLTLELEEKVDELADVREQVRIAAGKHDEQVGQLASENEQLSAEKQRMIHHVQNLQTEGQELTVRYEKLQADKATVEQHNAQLQAKVAHLQEEMEKLKEQHEEDAMEKANQMTIKNDMLAKLKADLQAAKQHGIDMAAERKIKEDDLMTAESRCADVQTELDEARQEMTALQKQLEELRFEDSEERKKFASSHTTLQQTAEALKETSRDQRREIQKLTKQRDMLQREVKELTAAHDEMSKENDTLEEKVQDLEYKIQLEEHNAKKQTLIAERMRGKVEQQDADLKKLRKSKKQLVETANERIDNMNAETKRLETLANNYRSEYEMLAARFQRYRERKHNPYYEEEADAEEVDAEEVDAEQEHAEQEHEGGDVAMEVDEDQPQVPQHIDPAAFATPQQQVAAPQPRPSHASSRAASDDHDLFDDAASANLLAPAGTPVAPSPVASHVSAAQSHVSAVPSRESVAQSVHSVHSMHSVHSAPPALDTLDYKSLQNMAKSLGLKQNGTKKDLIRRIEAAQEGVEH